MKLAQVILTYPTGKEQIYRDSGLDRFDEPTAKYLAGLLRPRYAARQIEVTVRPVAR